MNREDMESLVSYLIAISDRGERLSFQEINPDVTDMSVWAAVTRMLKLCRRRANPGFKLIDQYLTYDTNTPVHGAGELLLEHLPGLSDLFELTEDGPQFEPTLDDELREELVEYVDEHWDWRSRFHRMKRR